MPYRLQEIYCGVLDGKIHVAGGFLVDEEGNASISDRHIVYDPGADQWESKASIPFSRHHLQMVGHKGKLYGLGGFEATSSGSVWVMHQQTWAYDPESDGWTEKKAAPRKHGETVAGSLGNRIHLVGGRHPQGNSNRTYADQADTDHHLVYEPDSDHWSTAAPALLARNSASGAVMDGLLYVTGGRTVQGGNVADLEIYDPQEDRWRKGAPMPQAQGGLAAASVGGKLFAFGGEYFNDGGGVYSECWEYDPARDQWSAATPMRTPRHGLGGAAAGNVLFAIGGAKKASLNETSDLVEAVELHP